MLGAIKRFFRRNDDSLRQSSLLGLVSGELCPGGDLVETDWIEARYEIAEGDLDFSGVSSLASKFATRIARDVSEERLVLPTLPELGLAVRRKVQDPLSSTADLTRLLQIDLTISSKLIQVANSPAYAGYEPVNTLNHAITRMGTTAVKDIVTGLTLKQLFVTKQPRLRRRLRHLWEHSVTVAANCAVLARHQTNLDPEKALLAGLIHDVGELAIIQYANLNGLDDVSDLELEDAITELKPRLGAILIRSWSLGEEFVAAALHADDLQTVTSGEVQLLDLIHVAQLHSQAGIEGAKIPNLEGVPAIRKLGLAIDGAEKSIVLLREAREEIERVRLALAA